jgi:hypothetical protein
VAARAHSAAAVGSNRGIWTGLDAAVARRLVGNCVACNGHAVDGRTAATGADPACHHDYAGRPVVLLFGGVGLTIKSFLVLFFKKELLSYC